MGNATSRCLLAVCLIGAQLTYGTTTTDHGVGFSLSLDYGVASIYFSNGSSINVAKVKGGPSYKQMMRGTNIFNQHATPSRILLDDPSKLGTRVTQAFLSLQSLRHYWPPWMNGNDAHTQSLSRMLRALNTAIESCLETSSMTVEVVFPFPVSDRYLDTLRSACASLSSNMPLSAQPPAGILAARAYRMGGECTDATVELAPKEDQRNDPEQLILTVDYSRAALTAMLVEEECGVFEYRRVLHNVSLGADGLSRGSESSHRDLTHALRSMISLPLEDGNGAGLTRISGLVLLGESTGDQRLQNALKEALGKQFGGIATSVSGAHTQKIDPLFAASDGVAQDCFGRTNS